MKSVSIRKRIAGGLVGIILFASAGFITGQTVASNPARPRHPNAGRVRTLTPVLTITDEDGSFYFKSPSLPQIGPDGSIYILDQKQLLRFNAQGRFIRNFFRPGQGPGELEYVTGYAVAGSTLIVHNGRSSKIVRYDLKGQIVSDTPAGATAGPIVLRHSDGRSAVFLKRMFPKLEEMKGTEGILANSNPLFSIPVEGGPEKSLGFFPTRMYFRKDKEGSAAFLPMDKVLLAPWNENILAIAHTEEYAVKILDLRTGNIIRTISRPYPRVETPPENRDGIAGGVLLGAHEVKFPASKYTADIVNLLPRGDELWVVTSTKAKGKGVLVDVFSVDGAYTDSFYLPLPVWPERHLLQPDPLAIQGDFLVALEKTEEGTYVLRKYRIGN